MTITNEDVELTVAYLEKQTQYYKASIVNALYREILAARAMRDSLGGCTVSPSNAFEGPLAVYDKTRKGEE